MGTVHSRAWQKGDLWPYVRRGQGIAADNGISPRVRDVCGLSYDVQRGPSTILLPFAQRVNRRLLAIEPPRLSPVKPLLFGATSCTKSSSDGGLDTGGRTRPTVTPKSGSCESIEEPLLSALYCKLHLIKRLTVNPWKHMLLAESQNLDPDCANAISSFCQKDLYFGGRRSHTCAGDGKRHKQRFEDHRDRRRRTTMRGKAFISRLREHETHQYGKATHLCPGLCRD